MTLTTETIARRSRQQHDMTLLIGKLKLHQQHQDDIIAIGGKTERDAKDLALHHLTRATTDDIIAAMHEIERIKLKTYASVKVPGVNPPPYAGIPDSINGITKADLRSFIDACKRTTFASGNKYQPLPTHDEAWQIYRQIFGDSHHLRQRANALRSRTLPKVSDDDVQNAAHWGFWSEMTLDLRRRAYKLLPDNIKHAIARDHKGNPDGAMDATREWYDEIS